MNDTNTDVKYILFSVFSSLLTLNDLVVFYFILIKLIFKLVLPPATAYAPHYIGDPAVPHRLLRV